MSVFRSVGARLSLALVLVVAAALGVLYLIVVPTLERNLTEAKLDQLTRAALVEGRRFPPIPDSTFGVDEASYDADLETYVEFELLRTLASNPGRVFSRRALLEAIWGGSEYRDPRTIDVHVRHLREKLERDARDPELIFTVRGVGYRFRDR